LLFGNLFVRNSALTVTTIHKQPLLLHYCGTGTLPGISSEAQTVVQLTSFNRNGTLCLMTCKGPISHVTQILNLCQNASTWLGITMENKCTSMDKISYIWLCNDSLYNRYYV